MELRDIDREIFKGTLYSALGLPLGATEDIPQEIKAPFEKMGESQFPLRIKIHAKVQTDMEIFDIFSKMRNIQVSLNNRLHIEANKQIRELK